MNTNETQKKARPLAYKLITGKDDVQFCLRISKLLEQGYELYGSPAITFNGTDNIVAQAVTLKKNAVSNETAD